MEGQKHTGGSRSCATTDARERVPPAPDARERVPPAPDARERVPPAPDARERVHPALLERHHPSRNSVMTYHDNRSVMLYVTVVADKRKPLFVGNATINCILDAWKVATNWLVGCYVIMPDHAHFFCAPATYPPSDFHRWMAYWKSLATKAYWRMAGGARSCATTDARERVPPERNPPLFQRECWDRQLRSGESYAQKWQYVRNNPVRKGLVANADDWPYQGQLNVLEWHEKI